MSGTVTLTNGVSIGATATGGTQSYLVTVTNTGASPVNLLSLALTPAPGVDAIISSQPALAGAPVGVLPLLLPNVATVYTYGIVFNSPVSAGSSPVGSMSPAAGQSTSAATTPYGNFGLNVVAQFSDGTTATNTLHIVEESAIPPFPVPQGGATQFAFGGNSNLIAVLPL